MKCISSSLCAQQLATTTRQDQRLQMRDTERDAVSSLSFCMHVYIREEVAIESEELCDYVSPFCVQKVFHTQAELNLRCMCWPHWLRRMIKAMRCSTWQRQKLVRMLCAMRENQHKNQKLKLCIDEVYGGGEQLSLFAFCFHDCVVLYLQGTILLAKYSHTILKTAILKLYQQFISPFQKMYTLKKL
jgi:hypothetical protein